MSTSRIVRYIVPLAAMLSLAVVLSLAMLAVSAFLDFPMSGKRTALEPSSSWTPGTQNDHGRPSVVLQGQIFSSHPTLEPAEDPVIEEGLTIEAAQVDLDALLTLGEAWVRRNT